jgi:Zn-dependent protease
MVRPHPFDAAPYLEPPWSAANRGPFPRTGPISVALLEAHDAALIRGLRPELLAAWTATLGSASFSVLLYAALSGPFVAFGLVAGMWFHELGHRWFARELGLPVSPIVFVPFVGAVQRLRASPSSEVDGALLALAGPLCGLWFAFACKLAFAATDLHALRSLGTAHAILALIDLLPVRPLDGGRVLGAFRSRRATQRSVAVAGIYAVLIAVGIGLV